jgi:hypothetical protein
MIYGAPTHDDAMKFIEKQLADAGQSYSDRRREDFGIDDAQDPEIVRP